MPKKLVAKQTRLGKALRDVAVRVTDDAVVTKLNVAANNLDRAVLSLGVKGERIKSLANYAAATRVYEEVTGEAYVPPDRK